MTVFLTFVLWVLCLALPATTGWRRARKAIFPCAGLGLCVLADPVTALPVWVGVFPIAVVIVAVSRAIRRRRSIGPRAQRRLIGIRM